MKSVQKLLASTAMAALLALPASAMADHHGEMKVKITPKIGKVSVMHNGKSVDIMRNQDQSHMVNPAFAKTSRKCPPFCIQPMNLGSGVETVGEVEVIHYAKRLSDGDSSVMLVDSRTPEWVTRGTIPGAVNIPFTKLAPSMGADPVTIADQMIEFGAKEQDGMWDFRDAKTIVLFCNGMWCGQSPMSIKTLLRFGYPADKIKWFRGGMQTWEVLGLTIVK
ncbi:sulfurtransferase [Solemya pervernicosa gill symbiont]|uniref:Sulfurtransferase n=2 Tax=Gammaproteobacteria incertae sedis TaxID=118884 RepID=A0A1T2LAI1_9GAMM|nr:rhodanese-like domain-containing protein [Candidatus Reidiella endopervernicosa]OOZ42054.1 sulfurtransferase [Solemya pervernicosa gill symbiont]QKQ26997.1 rhodanese-like domain-containing protein [Candidatus Reidiella endopervernicosa]